MGRIVGLDSDTAVLPRASRTSLPCCIPSRGYTQAGRLRGSVQTMADFQIHSKQKLFPTFNSMATPCCLVLCFGEMSRLHFQTRNAVRTGKKVIQIQRDGLRCGHDRVSAESALICQTTQRHAPRDHYLHLGDSCNICNRLYFVYSCGLYGILCCCGVSAATITVFFFVQEKRVSTLKLASSSLFSADWKLSLISNK